MSADNSWSQNIGAKIDHSLLQRVAIKGGHGTRCCPGVVHSVNVLVEERAMEESARKEGSKGYKI